MPNILVYGYFASPKLYFYVLGVLQELGSCLLRMPSLTRVAKAQP